MAKTSAEEKPEITSTGPRDNTLLLGHEAIETQLASVIDSSRLPQSLLITGAKGIGKATFAYRLARFLLAYDGKPQDGLFGPTQREGLALAPDHHVIRRMSASSHPDFLVIEPEFDEKKKERKAEIGVDIARKIGDFFSLTPAESLWRVVVVDAVDDMNRNAANAILKVLEEPPQRAVLLLVSHNPGRLLPTIRSRCQTIALQPPAFDVFARLLRHNLPDITEAEIKTLALLSGNSPGRAISLHRLNGPKCYADLLTLLSAYPKIQPGALMRFAEDYGKRDGDAGWRMMFYLIDFLINRIQRIRFDGALPEAAPSEKQTLQKLAAAKSLDSWHRLWEKANALGAEAMYLHLDRKLVLHQLLGAVQDDTLLAA